MNFQPTEEQRLLREQVALFVERNCNREAVSKWDIEGVFPEELHRAMVEMGRIGMVVPEAYGGTSKIQNPKSKIQKDIINRNL